MAEQYIKYEGQLCIMICRLCNGGVTKNGIAWHYSRHHKEVDICARKNIVKYSNNFDLCETKHIQYPNKIIPRIEELAVFQGVRCSYNGCNYACVLPSGMPDHLTLCHGWVPSKGIIGLIYIFNFVSRSHVDSM